VEITGEISIFYNYYWNLIKSGANGIIHHSPVGVGDEICDCPYYDQFTSRNDFDCDYELKFDLYRLGKEEAKRKNIINDDSLPFIGSSIPEKVGNINDEWEKITSIWGSFKGFFTGTEGILYTLLGKNLENNGFAAKTILKPSFSSPPSEAAPAPPSMGPHSRSASFLHIY